MAENMWKAIEAREGRAMEEIIFDLYRKYGPGLSQETIGEHLGVSQPTVSQWMKLLRLKAEKGGAPRPEIS